MRTYNEPATDRLSNREGSQVSGIERERERERDSSPRNNTINGTIVTRSIVTSDLRSSERIPGDNRFSISKRRPGFRAAAECFKTPFQNAARSLASERASELATLAGARWLSIIYFTPRHVGRKPVQPVADPVGQIELAKRPG